MQVLLVDILLRIKIKRGKFTKLPEYYIFIYLLSSLILNTGVASSNLSGGNFRIIIYSPKFV